MTGNAGARHRHLVLLTLKPQLIFTDSSKLTKAAPPLQERPRLERGKGSAGKGGAGRLGAAGATDLPPPGNGDGGGEIFHFGGGDGGGAPVVTAIQRLSAELAAQSWVVQVKTIETASIPVIKILVDPTRVPEDDGGWTRGGGEPGEDGGEQLEAENARQPQQQQQQHQQHQQQQSEGAGEAQKAGGDEAAGSAAAAPAAAIGAEGYEWCGHLVPDGLLPVDISFEVTRSPTHTPLLV